MATETPLMRSLFIQARVISALLMREILTRYGRHNIGFLWIFLEPMTFTLGITLVWAFTKNTHGSNLPIVTFAVTGYSTVLLWRNGVNRCAQAIEPNLSLLYHRNVRVIDLFISRIILEVAGGTMSLIALTLIFMATGLMQAPADLLTILIAWVLLAWFALALGLVIGALSQRSEMMERIWHTVTYLALPFSGAIFMVDWLPKGVQEFMLWVPMVHAVEMLRHGYLGDIVRTYENPGYLMLVNLILLLIGLALVRETGRKVEPA